MRRETAARVRLHDTDVGSVIKTTADVYILAELVGLTACAESPFVCATSLPLTVRLRVCVRVTDSGPVVLIRFTRAV